MGQKRLSDLRKVRELLTFEGVDDGEPYEIKVWVQKVLDDDHESCLRAADAAKARALLTRNDETSELWQAAYGTTVATLGDDPGTLAEYLSNFHVAERAAIIQAELGGDENSEWAKDGYLEGLLDAWQGTEAGDLGLRLAYAAKDDDPDSVDPAIATSIPEAIRVFAELSRFEDAVGTKVEAERAKFVREHEQDPLEDLRRKVVNTFLEKRGNEVWVKAYNRARLLYATRTYPDWTKRYFESVAEITETDPEFCNRILLTYEKISVEGTEGKGSPGPQDSSPQSGSSGEEGTSVSSGPTDATV